VYALETIRLHTVLSSPRKELGSIKVPKKILLAEDHTDIREMMATYLKLNGYEVIEASDGSEALIQALEHRPDAILMDIAMPVLNGIDSTRAMRRNKDLKQVPILCLTAFGELYNERAKKAGCNAVLQKPIDFAELDSLLRQHTH
jgi:CheY-like chemotaxis protein